MSKKRKVATRLIAVFIAAIILGSAVRVGMYYFEYRQDSKILHYLKENEIKIFVTGHTHIHKAYYVDNILFINPGSIDFPRDGIDGTYAVLNISETDIQYKFKTLFDDNVDLL